MDASDVLPSLIQAARHGPEAVLARVAAHLEPLGFRARRTAAPPHAVLWTRGASRVILSGHVDVVPPGSGWTRDPFGGEVADARIHGRGACDMLGSVACFLAAASAAREAPCAILLTTDEETRMGAAERALDEGLMDGFEAVVVGEPTSLAVGIAEKGVLWLRLTARGRHAHGSMPELGDNAAARLVTALPPLLEATLPGVHPILGVSTVSLGTLHAGEAVNQVPAHATAEIDVRFAPPLTVASVVDLLRARLPRDDRLLLEPFSIHPPFDARPNARLPAIAEEAVRAAGRAPVRLGLPYGTEASRYAPAGLDVVILGPGEPGLAHTDHESIAMADLHAGTRAYRQILTSYGERSA